jgi:hypothetical protein
MYSTKVVVEGGGQVRYSQPSSKDKKRKEKKNLVISLQIPKIVLKLQPTIYRTRGEHANHYTTVW